jgi:hypothetical protein
MGKSTNYMDLNEPFSIAMLIMLVYESVTRKNGDIMERYPPISGVQG